MSCQDLQAGGPWRSQVAPGLFFQSFEGTLSLVLSPGVALGSLVTSLGGPWAAWGVPWEFLGSSWRCFGSPWGPLGVPRTVSGGPSISLGSSGRS